METLIKSLQLLKSAGHFRYYLASVSSKYHQNQRFSTCSSLLSSVKDLSKVKENRLTLDFSSAEQPPVTKNVIDLVNNVIERKEEGRLFAVVQLCGKQFKVTNNDLIVVEGYWPPDIGDEIRLEKVLLLGSSSFSLVGRPILPLNQASVKATIIEKGLAHTRVRFKYIKRKQHRRINFVKNPQTFLRINSIELLGKVDELGDIDGTADRIF